MEVVVWSFQSFGMFSAVGAVNGGVVRSFGASGSLRYLSMSLKYSSITSWQSL